jgi:GAF domain-containing protein
MLNAPSHPQEETRINALKDLEILDTPPEEHFDGITRLAALICGTPIALFSLVDRDRVWFKSRYGFESQQSAPKSFLCAHTILNKNATLVPDPTRDDRCLDGSPLEGSLVTSAGKMQFYAGWPVYDPIHRLPIGSLCVIDHRARQLTHEQLEGLKTLRDQIQRHLLARRRIQETERATRVYS